MYNGINDQRSDNINLSFELNLQKQGNHIQGKENKKDCVNSAKNYLGKGHKTHFRIFPILETIFNSGKPTEVLPILSLT